MKVNKFRDVKHVKWVERFDSGVKIMAEKWGDLHRLQHLTWLVERKDERTTEQCSQP